MSLITSLVIGILFGKRIIEWLQLGLGGEIVRDLGLEGQMNKQGTPTMGGLIILAAILIPTLLFADLTNITQMMLLVTVWLGAIGFIDDYIKVFKKNKEGLAGRFKVIGQVGVGIIVGSIMWWHPDVTIKDPADREYSGQVVEMTATDGTVFEVFEADSGSPFEEAKKSSETTVPFMKDNSFDYERLVAWMGDWAVGWGWLAFIPLVILIVTANQQWRQPHGWHRRLGHRQQRHHRLGLGSLACVSSNIDAADYLNIRIPRSEAGGLHRRLCGRIASPSCVNFLPGASLHG